MDCIRPSFDALDIFNTSELGVHLRVYNLTTVPAFSTIKIARFQSIADQIGDVGLFRHLPNLPDVSTIDATARELAGLWTKRYSLRYSIDALSYIFRSKFNIVVAQVVGAKLTKLAATFIIMSFLEKDSFVERPGEKNLSKHEWFEQIKNWAGTQLLKGLESRLKVDKLAKSDKPQLEALFLLLYSALYGLTYELPPIVS
jgi:hypothetical protein